MSHQSRTSISEWQRTCRSNYSSLHLFYGSGVRLYSDASLVGNDQSQPYLTDTRSRYAQSIQPRSHRMLCSELTPGGMFGRMSGQRSRMNLGDGDEACFGPNRARPTRCSQSIEKRCSPLPRLVHGKHFPLPWHPSRGRSRPPGQPSLGSPGPVRVPDCPPARQPASQQPASQCPVLALPGAHLIIRSQSCAGTSRLRGAGRLEHTHSSFHCHLQPPV